MCYEAQAPREGGVSDGAASLCQPGTLVRLVGLCQPRTLEAAEKLWLLKGTGFSPYVTD
jgi:hypothetical protein